LEIFHIVKHFT